jgi:hypothetical protein
MDLHGGAEGEGETGDGRRGGRGLIGILGGGYGILSKERVL